ncbi:MAG: DUF2617 family protein [Planctomycetota bacterium]
MSNRTKQRKQFALHLLLYNRPLHPELFRPYRTEKVDRRAYSANVHLVDGGHIIEFTAGESHLTEIVVNQPDAMPERGQLENLLCRGERYHEADTHDNVKYMISTQEEQLPSTLYEATRQEILDYAQKRELMWVHIPATEQRGSFLGALDVERRAGELLVQSFHLFDDTQMVVKTQGLIEVTKRPRVR